MALTSTDLFVAQNQTDGQLYKVSLENLAQYVEGQAGINFRGSVDLNATMSGQISPEPPVNGDLYIVESDSAAINGSWTMADSVTTADENDRIIWDANDSAWVLIAGGSNTGGTLVGVTGTAPIQVDSLSDPTNPVVSIDSATTSTKGAVERLATAADVVASEDSPSNTAVVTADLLNATNKQLETLTLNPGGVLSVATDDVNGNGALTVSPNAGAVKVEIATATDAAFGVVGLADAAAIAAGTAGASNVVTADQLKVVADSVTNLDTGLMTIDEGGTDIVADALVIEVTDGDVAIGVAEDTFCPFNFAALADISTAP